MRLLTEEYSVSHKKPSVFLFTYGNLAIRGARAQFASNFFGCAGFEIIDNIGFRSIDEGVKAAKNSKAEIVVLCSSDNEYADFAARVVNGLKESSILVIAGNPEKEIELFNELGIQFFIHLRSNILDTLKAFLSELGIIDNNFDSQ